MSGRDSKRGWLRWFSRRDTAAAEQEDAPAELPPGDPPEPEVLRSRSENWLTRLAEEVAEGRRRAEIGGDEFWEQLQDLWGEGRERLAAQWVTKFIDIHEHAEEKSFELRARLIAMYEERGDLEPAVEHLEALTRSSAHALQSHYLLGEHYRRRGDEGQAMRHYEAVLAIDVDYPNVRTRLERLRQARGHAVAPQLGATMAGPETSTGTGSRYQLVRELGRGATGVVYLAHDSELEREVAIKLLHPHLASLKRKAECARFFSEARIAASLRHPNILAILDLDEDARLIVMELAGGGTLREVLRERGPRPLRRALERHAQILSALRAAHRRGIVHRDVKPANLMFRRDADTPGIEIVLGDFGIAHLPDAESAEVTAERRRQAAVGTLAYMAPEQRRAERADPRWDVYASAVVLYEMLTGQLPWDRETLLRGERSEDDFALPEELTSTWPPVLADAVSTHLTEIGAPDREQRATSERALLTARHLRDLAIARAGKAAG